MLSYLTKKPFFFNKNIREYYMNSTRNFINKIYKKNSEEKKKVQFSKETFNPNFDPKPNIIISFLLFYTIISALYLYYKYKNKYVLILNI